MGNKKFMQKWNVIIANNCGAKTGLEQELRAFTNRQLACTSHEVKRFVLN